MLMAQLAGSQLDGLCYRLIDWFYVIGQLTLTELRKKKNLECNFYCKFIPVTGVKNLSKIVLLCFIQNCQYLSGRRTM